MDLCNPPNQCIFVSNLKKIKTSHSFDEFISQPTTWNVEVNDKLQIIKIL